MSENIALFADEACTVEIGSLDLGEVIAPITTEEIFAGEPMKIFAKNIGSKKLRAISANLRGSGASVVQLSRDVDGEHGVWAAPGEPILIQGEIEAGQSFSFWARGFFTMEDSEGEQNFNISFSGLRVA